MLSKRDNGMPSSTSSNHVCCPRFMMACHPRYHPTVSVVLRRWWPATPDAFRPCVVSKAIMTCRVRRTLIVCGFQGQWCHAMIDIVWSFVLTKVNAIMSRLTSSNREFYRRAMITCYTRRHLSMCVVQGRPWHSIPNIVRPCVMPKDHDGMPRLTQSYHVCCPRAMISCHAWCHPTVCEKLGLM